MSYVCLYIVIAALLVLSGIFSGSEMAFATVNRLRLKRAAEGNDKRAARALRLISDYSSTICTILVGNNLVNIAASSIVTTIALKAGYNVTAAGAVFTVVLLTVGEIMPKTVMSKRNYRPTLFLSGIINVFTYIFKPAVFVINKAVNGLSPLWTPRETEHTSDKELITIVETAQEEGAIEEKQGQLIKSAIEFCDIKAYEIMTPRVDVIGFDIGENSVNALLNDDNVYEYSYMPVYEDNLDNIKGILNTKALLYVMIRQKKVRDITPFITEPLYVHKTKDISAILKDFKQSRKRLAVVLDEYGGTMGIITMEDILEEIVGEIWDETDDIEEEITHAGNVYTVDGDMNIYDFFEELGCDGEGFEGEYSTVGGWVTDSLERFAQEGDTFTHKNVKVTVTEVDNMRVLEVLAEVVPQEQEE